MTSDSSPWTPTDDQVRTEWVESGGEGSETTRLHAGAAFDRWLARVKRAAKAEALDEASNAHFPLPGGPYPSGVIRDWLRARAAAIREQVK